MINTSAAYKEAIKKNRIIHHEAKIEFADGATLTPQDQELYTFKVSENTSNENSFDIGSAIAKQLELKIDNIDGEYSKHKFVGAKITARVGLEVPGKTEWLKKGVFYADPGKTSGDTISVTAVDSMIKFDVPYSNSKLKYPATLGNIVRDACSVCGVTMSANIASFDQSDFTVATRPSDSSLNFRNILQTDIVVNIDNYLFGERDDNQAIVRIDKGEDENTIVSSDGYPDFEVNEKVLLFLSRDDSDIATDEDYYVLTGMRQGKYDLSESENSRSSNTINTYISSMEVDNERDTEVIDELKDKIEKEHNMHPNYSDEQKQRQIEIDNENKKLFGK